MSPLTETVLFVFSLVALGYLAGLTGYLKERNLKQAYFVGLATDFCVAWSALDARKAGFEAAVIEDATRGIDAGGSLAKAWADMTGAGVQRLQSSALDVPAA